jgi:hypothetical protein
MIQRRPGAGMATETLAVMTLVGVFVAGTACSSGGSPGGDDAGDSGAGEEPTGPAPGADVGRPSVTGPVTGGSRDQPFNAMPPRLAERYGYVEEEYVLEGEATAYRPAGELGEDGRWAVTEAGAAPYRSRILVRRPADPDAFDGTVFVEWLNVTAGVDGDPDFGLTHPELLEHGSVYVGVSAQRAGIEGVPVLQFLTETDLFGVLGFHRARQDDSDRLRTWEVAGTAHADRSILDYNAEMAQEVAGGGFDLVAECGSINEGSQAQVLRAAIAGLRAWVVDGDPPPAAPPLEVEGQAIARDERGIALGGIRTPAVDAPVSVLTGEAPPGRSVLCLLFGDTRPFDAATLAALYPTHQDYVDAVTGSADAAVAAGFLRQAEADAIVGAAEDTDVPA